MMARLRRELSPLPAERVALPLMLQTWQWLTFLHWRYDPEIVRRLLPQGLALDTLDGDAWVGLTPFACSVRPPLTPRALALEFPETNLRTYVLGPDGTPGIWFFSLDASRRSAVWGARAVYGLPYMLSDMRVTVEDSEASYESSRRWPREGASSHIRIRRRESFAQSELGGLDHFLTARWRLYTVIGGGLWLAKVHHEPWPLVKADVVELDETLTSAAGLPRPAGAPLAHFSPGVEVRVGPPQRATTR